MGSGQKKDMFTEHFVASFQYRGLPSSTPPCRSCIFCYSERYFAAQLSGRRACQCPVHRPKCQQEEPISLSIPKAMVHKISFDSISGSAGASEIYLDIFCPWEDMIKSAATFATLIRPTTSQRKVNWGPLKDPSSQTEMEQTWKLWWWVLRTIKSESQFLSAILVHGSPFPLKYGKQPVKVKFSLYWWLTRKVSSCPQWPYLCHILPGFHCFNFYVLATCRHDPECKSKAATFSSVLPSPLFSLLTSCHSIEVETF